MIYLYSIHLLWAFLPLIALALDYHVIAILCLLAQLQILPNMGYLSYLKERASSAQSFLDDKDSYLNSNNWLLPSVIKNKLREMREATASENSYSIRIAKKLAENNPFNWVGKLVNTDGALKHVEPFYLVVLHVFIFLVGLHFLSIPFEGIVVPEWMFWVICALGVLSYILASTRKRSNYDSLIIALCIVVSISSAILISQVLGKSEYIFGLGNTEVAVVMFWFASLLQLFVISVTKKIPHIDFVKSVYKNDYNKPMYRRGLSTSLSLLNILPVSLSLGVLAFNTFGSVDGLPKIVVCLVAIVSPILTSIALTLRTYTMSFTGGYTIDRVAQKTTISAVKLSLIWAPMLMVLGSLLYQNALSRHLEPIKNSSLDDIFIGSYQSTIMIDFENNNVSRFRVLDVNDILGEGEVDSSLRDAISGLASTMYSHANGLQDDLFNQNALLLSKEIALALKSDGKEQEYSDFLLAHFDKYVIPSMKSLAREEGGELFEEAIEQYEQAKVGIYAPFSGKGLVEMSRYKAIKLLSLGVVIDAFNDRDKKLNDKYFEHANPEDVYSLYGKIETTVNELIKSNGRCKIYNPINCLE
ncbi:hypothetical protein [Vibrio sp. D431a]|uniref:hypothetical protein n=1 Tax=Vibrio sp. D431a TaxID=2837388 RepID=UPI002552E747|nr:hypothetical protein [Vibrio sp. D431a]MDK9789841.1 hypothetical protein [Vibrio sp. D431a]